MTPGRPERASVPETPESITWRRPSPAIARVVETEPFPALLLSPTRDVLALARQPRHPGLEALAREELKLGGLRIDPSRHDQSRREPFTALGLSHLTAGEEREIEGLPDPLRGGHAAFSPDGRHVSFTHVGARGLELWIVEVTSARARCLVELPLSAVGGAPYRWTPDGEAVIVFRANEAPAPTEGLPDGPVVLVNEARHAPARTYQDLLSGPHDEALFEYFLTTELVHVTLDGTARTIGEPEMYTSSAPSPDGRFLLVETIRRPFSYRVPAGRFPVRTEVRTAEGERVAIVADLPLADAVPTTFGSVRDGRRWVAWRADRGAQLALLEALDGGDAGREAEVRDRLVLLDEPFDGEPRELARLGMRATGLTWGDDELAMVSESWWANRRQRTWLVTPGLASAGEPPAPRLLFDRDFQDRYHAPGSPATRPTRGGRSVLHVHEGSLFLIGDGASPDGDHPFLDRLDLETLETTRLWQSTTPGYERPLVLLDPDALTVLLRTESAAEPPNYCITRLAGRATGERRAVTAFTDPTPELRKATKSVLRYTRKDGVELSGTLYLPEGYDAERDGPLPLMLWAYPRDYKSADTAGQVTAAPHRWDPIWWSSPLIWPAEGVAVLDDPAMPIVGEGETEPNDTYVEQLVMNAEAAVEAAVAAGVADRERIVVGGHSYGAFMTVHLLAHTKLFRAGIARSGSYNRTLTPFGFQSEERNFWEAREVYRAMSPFDVADRIEAPLLLVHGKADNNPGTYPEQSERLFDALKGLGKTARLVLLPHESHGYRARESVLHVLWEMTEWVREHVG